MGRQPQGCQARAQPAHDRLPFPANVEQAAMKRDRHSQPGEDKGGGVIKRIADAALGAKRAMHQHLDHFHRVLSHQGHNGGGGQQSDCQAHQGQ